MEIERKYLIRELPPDMPESGSRIEQGYISTDPVIRIRRRTDGDSQQCVLTVKGSGMVVREEYELGLTVRQYEALRPKCTGRMIVKTRYLYPLSNGLRAEVDLFEGEQQGLVLAEVEFPDEDCMRCFQKPDWFGEEVSEDVRYHNSYMSMEGRTGE